MRKLLLASAATLGAVSWLGTADAQTATTMTLQPVPSQGQVPMAPAASPPASAFTPNNTTGAMSPGSTANPTPGSVVVHINGRVVVEYWGSWTSVDKGTAAGGNLGYKVSPNNMGTYARLYTGVDGMATNGLRYGGSIEVRENFTTVGQANGSTSTPGFGALVTSASSGASGFSCDQTLYVRRAFGYVAGENWGIVRFGQGDGPVSLFDNGITSAQFDAGGNLNGGDLQGDQLGALGIPFIPTTVGGNEYTTEKLVYISPQFSGFDFGFSWSPYSYDSYAVCSGSGPGPNCVATSSGAATAFGAKTLNVTEAAVRYQGKFGDLGVLAWGAWVHGGTADYTGPFVANPTSFATAAALGSGSTGRYDNMNFGEFGTALTWGPITVSGLWTGGAVNGQFAPRPAGGSMTNALVGGLVYANGPFKVGVAMEYFNDQGATQLVGLTQRHEWAVNPGIQYTVAPGLIAFGEALYQARYQSGYNFVTGAAGSLAYNNVNGKGFLLGTTVYW
jgi:outer membrane protein OmpU